MKIAIINGPNLNLLGKREPEIYGNINFEDFFKSLQNEFQTADLIYFQSNHEGSIIDTLHEIGFSYDGIILNAGAYSHTSIAIADAVRAISTPVIEVHLSNIYSREPFRHHSYISETAVGVICGFGLQSYKLALQSLINL
ncbi:type II 3-dehydroquinate dehydratase [Flavobacterium sp. CBA20B-1]|uniref:type II 3-dehydroquinate dehydratase n=1 Tax=unclassified Flavobacterium TaxID=196869 RepID=UPI002224BFC0|nr:MULTISPECIES: type II 3-dehydroquinate dehydratase [unclassified Flavobacterium]WCM43165.1 type II 3-dehydroquinate dehydratase [Flavobacterium sp. CBA20B-1]